MNPITRFLLLAFSCLAFSIAAIACIPADPPEDPVVVILRDGLPQCSGFAIGRNEILTANHCVNDRESIAFVTAEQWRFSSNAFQTGMVVWRDDDRDLAGLRVKLNFKSPVELRELVEGEAVRARSVFYQQTSRGMMLAGDGYFRDSTITVIPGWSGSPVFGVDGKVVGLIRSCFGGFVGTIRFCYPDNAVVSLVRPGFP
jgi:S1-C subfamily serine protease